MLNDLRSLASFLYPKNDYVEKSFAAEDRTYAYGGFNGAVTLGSTAMGGNRSSQKTSGFDYLSSAQNTIDCYYQKIDDLRYYETHDLTEKVVGLFRDYINQLWKEGSEILDIPGEDASLVEALNKELEGMNVLEVLTKDLDDVIFYGSVSYEITESGAEGKRQKPDKEEINKGINGLRNSDRSIDPPSDRKYSFLDEPLRGAIEYQDSDFYNEIRDTEYARPTHKSKAEKIVDSTQPSIKKMLDETKPSHFRGTKEFLREDGDFKTADQEGANDTNEKLSKIRSTVPYKSRFKLNKLKFPHHTIVEYDRVEGRRYLVRANKTYHLPTNKHNIFYYGNDSMRIVEASEGKSKGRDAASDIHRIIGIQDASDKKRREDSRLGINPKDPKKRPTKYELLNRELSAGVPLFYHHLPKVRELYLKDLVLSILGIKDVIQPDILAMNFEGGMDIDQAQDMCSNLEDLLNKNSDYSIFNSATLDYNQLVKLLVDTVRILPDIEGKIQSLNPVRTTTLQDKIQQIRMEYQELNRNIISALGVPMDLFEGNSSKWEVIKRSERLQSKVNYYINTIKTSIRRLAQSVFKRMNDRELKVSDFKILIFTESDLEIAAKTNRLQSLNELNQTLMQMVAGAERELAESRLINKEAYFKLLKSGLKEVYPEIDDLIDIDAALGRSPGQTEQATQEGAEEASDMDDMDQYQQ